jgi:hypothetical protein
LRGILNPPPLSPSFIKGGGRIKEEGLTPLLNTPCYNIFIRTKWGGGNKKGGFTPLLKNLPLPFIKGKGIQGIGFINSSSFGLCF